MPSEARLKSMPSGKGLQTGVHDKKNEARRESMPIFIVIFIFVFVLISIFIFIFIFILYT